MSILKPYRLLNDPNFVNSFNDAFAMMELEVSDHFEPGNAYAPALVKLRRASQPSANFIVQFDRVWWTDRMNYEDSRISLKLNGFMLTEIDVTELLRTKLSLPLSEYIVGELAEAAQNAT